MKVAIDLTPLYSAHQFRGIGFYTKRLVEALKKVEAKSDLELELVKSIDKLKYLEADLIHYPYFTPFFFSLPPKNILPTVITVHDLIPIKYKEHFPAGLKGNLRWQVQKRRLKKAQAIITDSHVWQKEISRLIDYSQEKIFPIPLAAGDEFKVITDQKKLNAVRKKYSLHNNFILYVGDVNWNKNILSLIQAFSLMRKKVDIKLIFVGQAFKDEALVETREIIRVIESGGLSSEVIRLGRVETDADLMAIYNLATVYCQPSYDEGFGLPVLEAMACGCPAVVSHGGSLPEVADSAALSVKSDSQSLADGLLTLVTSREQRDLLKAKGLTWSKNFSWEETARLTVKVYQEVLAQ